MKRILLSVLLPPLAVCRFGCAGCCAAPIAVFWLAGIGALVYGYLGGPLELEGISWNTMALGALLWAIAAVWALVTVHTVDEDKCRKETSPLCNKITPGLDESNPLDEVRKAR